MPDPREADPWGRDPEEPQAPSLEDELFGTDSMPETGEPGPGSGTPPRDRRRADGPASYPARGRPRERHREPPRPWRAAAGLSPREIVTAISGFVTFVFVDSVMMYAPYRMREAPSLLPQMLILLLLAFGLGGLLAWHIRGAWRPFGIGMMLGWAFLTLVSAGFLTGLNP